MTQSRPLDHLVLPVTDLATARLRLVALGFTVAADARHPFGTENACVYFSDRTYLEPLAIGNDADCEASARAGNQFTGRDRAFRFRNGEEGFASVALGTDDADADHQSFRAAGLCGGDQLRFSRTMKLPDGTEVEPQFTLSFSADLRSPDFHAFTCERANLPPVDRSMLERHDNGATAIAEVVLSEQDPSAFVGYLQAVTGGEVSAPVSGRLELQVADSRISVLDPATLQNEFGVPRSSERGLRGEAVVFRVADLAATERLLAGNGVRHMRSGGKILVPREPGQGTLFAFSE
ncbi:MAG: VOC family protein [Rhizobium sp.]|nr:VOC family protein [Rhizobium sp.]